MANENEQVKVTDEKSAMRLLANELDYAIALIARLSGSLASIEEISGFPIDEARFASNIKDARRMRFTLEGVNKFTKSLEGDQGYSIKKKDGWFFEKQAKEVSEKVFKRMESFKSNVVDAAEKIVNPDNFSQN
jgi:hypothetical protein